MLGTPNDESGAPNISKQGAFDFLNLQHGKFTITLASTWIEARYFSTVVTSQVEHVEFFNCVLADLKKLSKSREIQIIIKLHPAHSEKQIFKDTKFYLRKYAESIEVKISLITYQHLRHISKAFSETKDYSG